MLPVAAIIVTYNSREEIGDCLRSLSEVQEIVVIDNASADGTQEVLRKADGIAVVENVQNRGFAAAVNQGVRASTAPYILLLNPDVTLLDGLGPLLSSADRHGAAAGQLVGVDGLPQAGFTIRRFPTGLSLAFMALGVNRLWRSNGVDRQYRCLDHDLQAGCVVDQPAGAFLLVRRDVFESVGGLDESFWPVWFEDVDFCQRLYAAGHSIWYEPAVRARHTGGHSVSRLRVRERALYWNASLLRYAGKYFPRLVFTAIAAAVGAGALLRMMAGITLGREVSAAYARVLRLAVKSVLLGRVPDVFSAAPGGGKEREGAAALSHPVQ